MSEAITPESAPCWPVLNVKERRLLGVLVEKAKTTPDVYPMSLNALVTGSNQKSNRDPVLSLTEVEVEEALLAAQHKGLVTRIQGGRVEKWRQNLYEVFQVDKVELAVLAELLLRGPQTEGELRGRASRMEPIPDLESLRKVLGPLAQRHLVVFLGPEGRRGTLITHGFHSPSELEALRSDHRVIASLEGPSAAEGVGGTLASPPSRPSGAIEYQNDLAAARAEIASLREQLNQVQHSLGSLTEQVQKLKEALGG